MLSAALVAQTAHMRAAGLCALSRVVYVCPGARGDLPALLEKEYKIPKSKIFEREKGGKLSKVR